MPVDMGHHNLGNLSGSDGCNSAKKNDNTILLKSYPTQHSCIGPPKTLVICVRLFTERQAAPHECLIERSGCRRFQQVGQVVMMTIKQATKCGTAAGAAGKCIPNYKVSYRKFHPVLILSYSHLNYVKIVFRGN